MTETIVLPEGQAAVRDYVARVRGALGDLPPEDVEDLTGGLEADLAERAAELPPQTNLLAAFGLPMLYAAELRRAAGLPDPVILAPHSGPGAFRRFELWLHGLGQPVLARWPWLVDLLPVWWLARGFVLAYVFVGTAIRSTAGALMVGLLGAAASFAWSRRRTPGVGTWTNRLVVVANTFAALALLPVLGHVTSPRVEYIDTGAGPGATTDVGPGVWVNGDMASNLYAYDAAGNRIDNVRLFNQYGQAVSVPPEVWQFVDPASQPPVGADGQFELNAAVFPVRWGDLTGWEASTGGWEPPVKISELAAHSGGSDATAPSSSASTSASPSTSAQANPLPTVTP